MLLLPYQNYKIRTYLSPAQVQQKLNASVRPNRPFLPFGSSDKPFYGKITKNHFKIYRIIAYKNSFLPSTEGSIQADGNGSVIDITIQSDTRVLGFFMLTMLIFLVVFMGIFGSGTSIAEFVTQPDFATLFTLLNRILSVSLMVVSTYGMLQLVYLYEAAKAKSFVSKLLENTDVY